MISMYNARDCIKDISAKSWAAIPLRFQWKNVSEDDFFGPGFNSTSPDQINKTLFQIQLAQIKGLM